MVEILSKLFATLEEGKLISHFFKIESKSFDFQYLANFWSLEKNPYRSVKVRTAQQYFTAMHHDRN